MGEFSQKIDAYVAKSAPFAQPILEHLRQLVHKACPKVEETIKWGFPHFEYKGILCSMAAFKNHCSFGFWKGTIMDDPEGILKIVGKTSMGNFDRISALDDLPASKVMLQYVKQAVRLNEEDIQLPSKAKTKKSVSVKVPADLLKALKKNKKVNDIFQSFSNSHKKEYSEWIDEAKTESTRQKRITTAIAWISEGKNRNWKYNTK
jgi:uncharacterized protein YdeI (YjbR/CyaY-like superfamily)